MRFTGIPTAALDFYDDLELDNTRSFWTAHKQIYDEAVRAPMAALAAELAPEFGPGKLFRPHRDVRFARDKTPYKTHQGIWFDESSVYVQVSAAGLYLAAGYWRTSPEQVGRLRRGVAAEVPGGALARAVVAVRKARFQLGGEQLKRVPAGYPKDHPRADLLRHRTLTAHRELGFPTWLDKPRARTEIAKRWRTLAPLTDWLHTHVGPD